MNPILVYYITEQKARVKINITPAPSCLKDYFTNSFTLAALPTLSRK